MSDTAAIADAIPQATHHIDLDITGMTCASCAARIEKKLNKVDGITATVNYALESASIEAPLDVSAEDAITVVETTGYGARVPAPPVLERGDTERVDTVRGDTPDAAPEARDEASSLRTRMIVAIVSAIPVIAMAMIPPLQFDGWQWISLMLTWPIVTWAALPFHRAAWTNLRHGATTMDTLISLGVIAAFGWSVVALVLGDAGQLGMRHGFSFTLERSDQLSNIYLEAAAAIVTFLLIGRFVEARSKREAGAALRALLDLGAKDVAVLREGPGSLQEHRIPIDQLQVGDRFVVRPGEKIATDGTVISGHSALDTAMVTGESVPVDVGEGDPVIGGTVNTAGRLVVRADRVGADTQLAQIAALVRKAQHGKAKVQRIADRISSIFVPAVILFAVATAVFWLVAGDGITFALTSAVSVLIIACPCALGLATPTALMVGTGRGAQLGILLRGPEALEATRRVDAILVDKTGTLTTGEMTVVAVHPFEGVDPATLIRYAATAESGSEHPLAQAVVARAERLAILDSFTNTAGIGVTATITDTAKITDTDRMGKTTSHTVRVGRPESVPAEWTATVDRARQSGQTPVMVWIDDIPSGLIAIADTVREDAPRVVAELKRLGLDPVLLTGDHETAARAVADQVGIDTVIAGVMPQGKVDTVTSLQGQGKRVAMVGDGVNDAAALATADLGIAMGAGTDAAIQASDLTLVRDDLTSVVDGIRLARSTWRTIVSNLVWAFGYNVAAIPVAAAGLLNPMIAGGAMALSSVLVVLNSLRLRGFQPKKY